MTLSSPPVPAQPLASLQAQADAAPDNFQLQMELGGALHDAGQPELALVAFERARSIAPQDAQAASACATLFFELDQPLAAYACLAKVRDQLLLTADGACNLAVAAEACGHLSEAGECYERALTLEPDHVRSLNNTALVAARAGQWPLAVARANRCVELLPSEPMLWGNLCDMLVGSRDYVQALDVLSRAVELFPGQHLLQIRQIVVLAFNAEFDRASAALTALGPTGEQLLRDYLAGGIKPDAPVKKGAAAVPTPRELFTQQAFEALQVCDWRYNDALTRVIREQLAEYERTGEQRDWRDAQFYGLALALREHELAKVRSISGDAIARSLSRPMPAFIARPPASSDGRLRIGFATQSLRDPRVRNAVARQLSLHDASRFAIYIYSPTPNPEERLIKPLQDHAASAIEVAHMTTDEMVARIRLDRLDLFMDMAFYTQWCRPEVPARRVAPVQIRHMTWHRHLPPVPCEYSMSDTFVHPDGLDLTPYGPIVRLPHTCWLSPMDDEPEPPPPRAEAGIADDALVLGAFLPAVMVDPHSFSLWMQMLRALPDAVFLMPGYAPAAKANLQAAAEAAGITRNRLFFIPRLTRSETLARISMTDLFVDTVRCNANQGLVEALRMGVPALTCAGESMASRLGGSIVRAAGLPDCVFSDEGAFVDAAIHLGRNRHELKALRSRLQAARPEARLFDTASRIREWESAWTTMVERYRSGLAPAAFDVPSQN
ncbi:MAG: hypothetical protein H7346_20910 [Burkholderiaceae bacterium]|nr:hypothetical protein [Burkholderiaceae bacterium]